MRAIARYALLGLMVTALTGCGRFALFRSAASSAYFATKVCGVHVDGKSNEARLRIELLVTKSLPRDGFVEIEFENPSDPKVPLIASRSVTGAEHTLQLLSPPLTSVRARGYETVTRVYDSADKKEVLGIHTYVCQSLIDPRELGLQFR